MKKIIATLLVIIWMIVIFGFSKNNGDESSNLSDNIIKSVVSTITPIKKDSSKMEEIVEVLSFPIRKSAHFLEYFILAILVINMFNLYGIRKHICIFTIFFCFTYAITDETHQLFVSGRSGQVSDVLLDSFASLISTYLTYHFFILRGKNEKNHS